ncbi:MAG TPA: ATP-binding protein [Labilithrix sp.]|nr:ATP-binding protein [Labilithrix sp.]
MDPSADAAPARTDGSALSASMFDVERHLNWMRLIVTATGTLLIAFVPSSRITIPWVAYGLLALGWVYAICGIVFEPWRRYPILRSPRFTTATDASLTLLWVLSTGGVESPWFVAIYGSIIAVSLRHQPLQTILVAVYGATAYFAMALALGQLSGRGVEVAVRILFMLFVGGGAAVTARARQRRLTSRAQLLELTQEVGRIGTWEWSVSDGTLTWSTELHRIFGVPSDVVPTFEAFIGAVHPDDRARTTQTIEQALVDRLPFRFDHRIVSSDGTLRSLHCRGRVIVARDGTVRELVGSSQDVTDRRQMEDQLLLSGKLASLGTLASGVAHEINNPLAYVASNLELLDRQLSDLQGRLDAADTKPLLEAVAAARHGSARMRDIVRGLKTFSRIDQDGRSAVDLARVADLAIEVVSHQISPRARLVRDYAPTPPVPGNESRLSQVFMNLLVNAAQAIAPGAAESNEIRVRIHPDSAGRACFEISDTGSGIEPEHIGRIFDPFYTTNPTGEGTGLGLSICHGIVKELGGDIQVTSTGRKGSTFAITLPVVPVGEVAARPPSEPKVCRAATRKRICVVDDEARYAESLRLLLGYDHDVALAPSAERALELLSGGEAFDVIVCDLMMPGKTGMDLHEDLSSGTPDLCQRMIFLTGGATTERAREFLARPDIRHLEKPVELPILEAMIEEVTTLARAAER